MTCRVVPNPPKPGTLMVPLSVALGALTGPLPEVNARRDALHDIAVPYHATPAGHVTVPETALRVARMAVASWVNSSLADEGNRAALAAIDAALKDQS